MPVFHTDKQRSLAAFSQRTFDVCPLSHLSHQRVVLGHILNRSIVQMAHFFARRGKKRNKKNTILKKHL